MTLTSFYIMMIWCSGVPSYMWFRYKCFVTRTAKCPLSHGLLCAVQCTNICPVLHSAGWLYPAGPLAERQFLYMKKCGSLKYVPS